MRHQNNQKTSTYIAYLSGIALLLSIFMTIAAHGYKYEKIIITLLLIIGMIGLPISMIMHDCKK